MQRTVLIALTTAVLAASIAAGATILLGGTDEIVAPSPAAPTPASGAAAASPATDGATASPGAGGTTRGPEGSPRPTAAPSRTASGIDCSRQPRFCSGETGVMTVSEGALADLSSAQRDVDHSEVPSIEMTSKVFRPDSGEASRGDDVETLHVDVIVRNSTNDTFVFPKREIVLDIYLDGRLYEQLVTEGEGFEMTPRGEMRGKFDQPITRDGTYRWEAKTSYRKK